MMIKSLQRKWKYVGGGSVGGLGRKHTYMLVINYRHAFQQIYLWGASIESGVADTKSRRA